MVDFQPLSKMNEGAAQRAAAVKASGTGWISKSFTFVKDSLAKGVNATAYGLGRIGARTPLIIGGVLAAGTGLALWMGNKQADKARESKMALRDNQMEAMKADIIANQQAMAQSSVGANTLMGLEPVAGYHANRVRNGASTGIDVSPNMTAANFEVAR